MASTVASEPPLKILEDMDYNPYDYSDAKPRVQCVFNADMSYFGEWSIPEGGNIVDDTVNHLSKILEKLNFKMIEVGHETWSGPDNADYLFGRFDAAEKLKDCLVMHIEYSNRSRSLHISPQRCKVWDYKPAVHQILSWRYVNAAYQLIRYHSRIETIHLQKIAQRIKRRGLEQSFTRLGMVINMDHTASFHNVFETPKEKERGEAILTELQGTFS